ncbi:MAG: DNA double-strand break repair protein Rad50, partial ['Waltheria sp.' little leaf phytoplasma]|nr:DNA double-strand break repair protein Rad50 ['Waltheria sp.' little leaf phytoplasma]
ERELDKCEKELKDLHDQKDLTQEAKAKIQEALEKNEAKIKEIKTNLDQNDQNITILKGKLIQLEKDKEAKEKELKEKEAAAKLASPDDRIRLQAEIKKLQEELIKIVEEISEIKSQIGILEADRKYYQGVLTRAEDLKNDLEENFKFLSDSEKLIFNRIKTVEERYVEIQKEIEEVNEKIKLINIEKEQLRILRVGADALHPKSITIK